MLNFYFLMDKAEVGKAGVGKSILTLSKHLMFVGCTRSMPFSNLLICGKECIPWRGIIDVKFMK